MGAVRQNKLQRSEVSVTVMRVRKQLGGISTTRRYLKFNYEGVECGS